MARKKKSRRILPIRRGKYWLEFLDQAHCLRYANHYAKRIAGMNLLQFLRARDAREYSGTVVEMEIGMVYRMAFGHDMRDWKQDAKVICETLNLGSENV